MPKFSLEDYTYNVPSHLKSRSEVGYTSGEKQQMFGAKSITTIMGLLKNKRNIQAASGATGLSGGFRNRAMEEVDTEGSLQLAGVEAGVEEQSLMAQEKALSEVTSLEMDYRQAMLNQDLTLYGIQKQEEIARSQIKAQEDQNLLSILF